MFTKDSAPCKGTILYSLMDPLQSSALSTFLIIIYSQSNRILTEESQLQQEGPGRYTILLNFFLKWNESSFMCVDTKPPALCISCWCIKCLHLCECEAVSNCLAWTSSRSLSGGVRMDLQISARLHTVSSTLLRNVKTFRFEDIFSSDPIEGFFKNVHAAEQIFLSHFGRC